MLLRQDAAKARCCYGKMGCFGKWGYYGKWGFYGKWGCYGKWAFYGKWGCYGKWGVGPRSIWYRSCSSESLIRFVRIRKRKENSCRLAWPQRNRKTFFR